MEACAAIATHRGTMRTLSPDGSPGGAREAATVDPNAPSRAHEGGAVEHEGFNLHASVRIAADDDCGRERLCRYGARPPFSLERLRVLPGGRIAYRIKNVGAGRAKHRVMTPVELLARLAALIPPPRYPLVRFHGVLAPHAAWRREIVPRPPTSPRIATAGAQAGGKRRARQGLPEEVIPARGGASSRPARHPDRDDVASRRHAVSGRTNAALDAAAEQVRALAISRNAEGDASADLMSGAPNILSVRQWSRLLGGLLYVSSPRVRWPQLLRRTFDVDILECSKCNGRLRLIEAVLDTNAARQILERLGFPVDAPRLVRARDPTTLDGEDSEDPDAA